ncbi:MAG: ABC transporter substrate-binding protein, partial [Solirubrobacteraceae bacterium]
LEDRVDADLALGRHAALVGELEALVAEHPLRERLHGQLMLALYRSGRQADALERYQRARRRLVDELGIEPGSALSELERAILAHDPELEAPVRASPPRSAKRARRGGLLIAAGGTVLLATIARVAVMLSQGAVRVRVAPNSVAVIDPGTDTVAGAVAVGSTPGAIAFGSGSLWVANQNDQTVSRVDPQTWQTLQVIPVGQTPTGIAVSADLVWVAAANLTPSANAVSLTPIDPQFNAVEPAVRLGNVITGGPEAVAAQGDQVWAAPSNGLLTRLDATSGRIVQKLDPNATPAAIAIGGDGAVWIADNGADTVTRVDPTGLLTPIAVGNGPSGIAVGDGGVWVADSLDNAVVRIDPDTRAVTTTIPVGSSPAGIAVGAGSVWVADSGDGTVDRIDLRTDKVIATIQVGASPQALTVANGRVWVTLDAQAIPAGSTGGATLRIEWPTGTNTMDPALAYETQTFQLLQAVCANLFNLPDKPGPAGERPTPEVAQSLPTISADGTTYTFKIRPGFRFSPPSNEPVTAQTFKFSLERAFNPKMKSYTESDFSDIVGMSAYQSGKAQHISGIVARADSLVIRLVAPNPDLVARLTEPATCAVPSDTPLDPNGVSTLPSAGPYYLQSFTPGAVVLVRNPNYHGSRPHNFERIQVAMGMSPGQAIAAVKAGTADETSLNDSGGSSAGLSGSVAAEASQLAAEYGHTTAATTHAGPRFIVNPVPGLDYFVLNTHRPLFSDVRMRQAVNYAINRSALAALGGGNGSTPDHPADHYLPPGLPGYRDVHVYPLTPDLAKARALAPFSAL